MLLLQSSRQILIGTILAQIADSTTKLTVIDVVVLQISANFRKPQKPEGQLKKTRPKTVF